MGTGDLPNNGPSVLTWGGDPIARHTNTNMGGSDPHVSQRFTLGDEYGHARYITLGCTAKGYVSTRYLRVKSAAVAASMIC